MRTKFTSVYIHQNKLISDMMNMNGIVAPD